MTPKAKLSVVAAIMLLATQGLPVAASVAGSNSTPLQIAQASAPTQPTPTHRRTRARKHAPASADVKAAQEALNKKGAHLATDGKMGPKTHAAIRDFQKANNLNVTGRLDAATRKALGI